MSESTAIAWTDHTFNLAWGCTKVSPGCKNCYADTLSKKLGKGGVWGRKAPRRTFGKEYWGGPLKWQAQAQAQGSGKIEGPYSLVFCSSMCDVFEDHPTINQERERLWALIRRTPNLHWQILTKRADRIEDNLPEDWGDGWPNVWLGTSIENSDYLWRADFLRKIPAVVRFISYEPALGPLDSLCLQGIDWIIYGGESGADFRDHDLEWPRAMRRMCEEENVAFFYKQSAAHRTEMGTNLDGETVRNYPVPRKTEPVPQYKEKDGQQEFV